MDSNKKKISSLVEKYKEKLSNELSEEPSRSIKVTSREYDEFRKGMLPPIMNWYEKGCQISEKILNIKPDPKEAIKIQEAIDTCHLQITPTGTKSVAILAPLVLIILGTMISLILPYIVGSDVGTFGIVMFLITGFAVYGILNKYPLFLASSWRLKASNEMVLSVFYVVTFMRHTSNLENALVFASDHLTGPLSLDLRKVIWDLETEKYDTLKSSLDAYLFRWKDWNSEFVEAFHLIEASLFESSDERRLTLLDKSLDVILEETYEKMLHYAHNLHSPITMLHMLGVILPILGLVILPLLGSFMTGPDLPPNELAFYIFVFYNIALPLIVYSFGKNILASRPTGYGSTNLSGKKGFEKYNKVDIEVGGLKFSLAPMIIATIIGLVGLTIAFTPIIMHATMDQDFVIHDGGGDCKAYTGLRNYDHDCYGTSSFQFLGYIDGELGPYGLGASILSLFLPLSLGASFGLYYTFKTKKLMKIRNATKKLENEFASSLFQLGNRLGDGLPAEIAITRVASVMTGSVTGNFFNIVTSNITRLGMSVKQAIFDKKIGAIIYYPSNLIESSMKVLVESSRKGPIIAAQALLNISRYVKEIHRVNERLTDLMTDIISSMKSQISFLTPVISGIVIGITSMVTYILSRLTAQMDTLADGAAPGQMDGILDIFGDGIPTYYTQIIVGFYVIQITYLLTIITNSVENGSDKLNEESMLGKNLLKSSILYVIISLVVMLIFNSIASSIISTM